MNNPIISVCIPGIRKNNWLRLYNSIASAVGDFLFELVIYSPEKELPNELVGKDNIKLVNGFAAPTVGQQISIENASGKYIMWAADDGWFYENSLIEPIRQLERANDKKTVYFGRFIEDSKVYEPNYYILNNHDAARSDYHDPTWLLFLVCIVNREYFNDVGGLDCNFEACPMAFLDFGIRVQRDGCKIINDWSVLFECTQFIGTTGDHGPIHYAQKENDEPLYQQIYSVASCQDRIKIPFNNYLEQKKVWTRRFGNPSIEHFPFAISVVLPGIRHKNWEESRRDFDKACERYSFNFVFYGPFDPLFDISKYPNTSFIKTYQSPTVCFHRGVLNSQGRFFYITVDDCSFVKNSIDDAIDLYLEKCGYYDIVNMKYSEGGNLMPDIYWNANYHNEFKTVGIENDWKWTLQPLMNCDAYIEYGGLDLNFDYWNMSLHDLIFRMQRRGSKIYNTNNYICHVDCMPGYSGDREVIESLHHTHELPLFLQIYNGQPTSRYKTDITSWRQKPIYWPRRFTNPNSLPSSYEELFGQNVEIKMPRYKDH